MQCLTGAHVCDEVIVRELFSRLNGLDDAQHFKASALLKKLSRNFVRREKKAPVFCYSRIVSRSFFDW